MTGPAEGRWRDDRGVTLVELLVATALFAVVSTIITSAIVRSNEVLRKVTYDAAVAANVRDFNDAFSESIRSAIAIRRVGTAGSPTTTRTDLRFDYYNANGQCMTFEVRAAFGRPNASFTTDVHYFTYRRGQMVNASNAPICAKNTEANTTIRWLTSRYALGRAPNFRFFNGASDITSTLPTDWTLAAGWDAAAYANITRFSYVRTTTQDGDTAFQGGGTIPPEFLRPSYN